MLKSMLTTSDNPHNPFEDYEAWESFDSRMGYHTPAFLARMVLTSEELSETDQQFTIELAIDDIVKENILGLYQKVQKEVEDLE